MLKKLCQICCIACSVIILTSISALAADSVIPSHRVTYGMSLKNTKQTSPVTKAGGQMVYEWRDDCDSWAVRQDYDLKLGYQNGQGTTYRVDYITLETKDGGQYAFNIKKHQDGVLTEEIRGMAYHQPGNGIARFTLPTYKKIEFPKPVIFPNSHTVALLQAAQSGQKVFSATVFDGNDMKAPSEFSAVIGNKVISKGKKSYWPVRIAFFSADEEEAAPDYEMDMHLQDNGVTSYMSMDYGDFIVDVKMKKVEMLPKSLCP